MLCGKPTRPVQDFHTSSLLSRLTDVSLYGGTHKRRWVMAAFRTSHNIFRFDSKGKGLGMSGRRDIRDLPTLWPRWVKTKKFEGWKVTKTDLQTVVGSLLTVVLQGPCTL